MQTVIFHSSRSSQNLIQAFGILFFLIQSKMFQFMFWFAVAGALILIIDIIIHNVMIYIRIEGGKMYVRRLLGRNIILSLDEIETIRNTDSSGIQARIITKSGQSHRLYLGGLSKLERKILVMLINGGTLPSFEQTET